jgi:hypothetical protein
MEDTKRFIAWSLVLICLGLTILAIQTNHPPTLTLAEKARVEKNLRENMVMYNIDGGYVIKTSVNDKESIFKIYEEERVYRKNGYQITERFWGPSIDIHWNIAKPIQEWQTNHR